MISLSSLKHSHFSETTNATFAFPESGSLTTIDTVCKSAFYAQTFEFYQKCAEIYDYLYPDHLIYSERLFESLLSVFRQYQVRKVLDASCGVGHDMSCLMKYGFKVDGMDISSSMLTEAERRLSANGFQRFSLYQGDVRFLDSMIHPNTYDLVLFRGNTFSNIKPTDLNQAIVQLIRVTRPGGILCLDYRNGHVLLNEKRRFEFRGAGYNKSERVAYFSYYKLSHSERAELPYRVRARVLRFSMQHLFRADRVEIYSHYVVPENVRSVLISNGCELLPTPSIPLRSLPELISVVAVKTS